MFEFPNLFILMSVNDTEESEYLLCPELIVPFHKSPLTSLGRHNDWLSDIAPFLREWKGYSGGTDLSGTGKKY